MSSPKRTVGHARALTAVEMLIVLVIIGILATVTTASLSATKLQVIDRAGPALLSGAIVDARAVASANHYRYNTDAAATAAALNTMAATHASAGTTLTYVAGPSGNPTGDTAGGQPATLSVSVAVLAPSQVALAVTTSVQPNGTRHCVIAVDSLRNGTTFATVDTADVGCAGQLAQVCAATWQVSGHDGTAADPYTLQPTAPCLKQ